MNGKIDMSSVRGVLPKNLIELKTWPEFWQIWTESTERSKPDWLLPVAAAEACGAKEECFEQLISIVAAVGCAQISIILVDDVLDEDPRGAHQNWGVGMAANLAMAFQAAALQLVNDNLGVWVLGKMLLDTAIGQALDMRGITDEAGYWQLVQAKSTPFYGAALALGGVVAEMPQGVISNLYRLGRLLGEIVQVRDDLIDAMADPASPDWERPLCNLLLLYGQQGQYGGEFMELLIRVRDNREGALTEAQIHLVEVGAVAYCEEVIRVKLMEALEFLKGIELEDKRPLVALLERQRLQFDSTIVEASG
jgi:geranylgeranyl pyrophosphate synthase